MFGLFGKKKLEQKQAPNVSISVAYNAAQPRTFDLHSFYEEGFKGNAVASACIKILSHAFAQIPFYAASKNRDGSIEDAPDSELQQLIDKPNIMQGKAEFLEAFLSSYLYAGNAFVLRNAPKPTELWLLPAVEMSVKASKYMTPAAYVRKLGNGEFQYPFDQLSGDCDIFHFRTTDPNNPYFGLSPFYAIARNVDMSNAGESWNYSLLNNGAKPDGIIKQQAGTYIDAEAESRLREFFSRNYSGIQNASKVAILPDGLDFQQLSMSAKDMDFMNTMSAAEKKICMKFGVPYVLVFPESSTYDNMRLAQLYLFENTILPLAYKFADAFNRWIGKQYKGVILAIDEEAISVFEIKNETKATRLQTLVSTGIITRDEARMQLGYDTLGGNADKILIPAGLLPIDFDDAFTGIDTDTATTEEIEKHLYLLGYDEITIKSQIAQLEIRKLTNDKSRNKK